MSRQCRRNTCSASAVATLTFRYDTAQAWLQDLVDNPDPQQWDLCPAHAGKLTVPRGWELVDARTAKVELAAQGRLEDAPVAAVGRDRRPANRYADLMARLPELAAAFVAESPLLVTSSSPRHADALPLEGVSSGSRS